MDSVARLVQALDRCRALNPMQRTALTTFLQRRAVEPRGVLAELFKRDWLTSFQIKKIAAGQESELLLGSYVLLDRIGEGGMGQVFKARHWKLGRVVAIKLIHRELLANPTMVARFRREIQTIAQLDHPNIIRALDAEETEQGHFIVMEHVEGTDLGHLVQQSGPLPPERACDYLRQTAWALQHAHEKGLIHRDIKPSNLLLASQGNRIKLLDLGLARLQTPDGTGPLGQGQPQLTQLGVIVGTVDFIAPEQAVNSSKIDIRADLYSLGCTLHYLLTGKPPFPTGTPSEKLLKHNLDPRPALPRVSPTLTAVVHKLMARNPSDRYQTPGEVAVALEQLLVTPEKLRRETVTPLLTVPVLEVPPSPVPKPSRPASAVPRPSATVPRIPADKPRSSGSHRSARTRTPSQGSRQVPPAPPPTNKKPAENARRGIAEDSATPRRVRRRGFLRRKMGWVFLLVGAIILAAFLSSFLSPGQWQTQAKTRQSP